MEKVAIFWDYENCALPTNAQPSLAVNRIRQLAHKYGSVTVFKTYMELPAPSSKSITLRSELQSSGVSLIDCPHNGQKDVADKMIMVDMLAFAIDNVAPATIILITGDCDFAYAVSTLQLRRYNIVLLALSGARSSLTGQASEVFVWPDCVAPVGGVGVRSTTISPEVSGRRSSRSLSASSSAMPHIALPTPRKPVVVTSWDSPQTELEPTSEVFSLSSWRDKQAQLGFTSLLTPPSSDEEPVAAEQTTPLGEVDFLEAALRAHTMRSPPLTAPLSPSSTVVSSAEVSGNITASQSLASSVYSLDAQGLTVTPASPWKTFDDIPTFVTGVQPTSSTAAAAATAVLSSAAATPPPALWQPAPIRPMTFASVASAAATTTSKTTLAKEFRPLVKVLKQQRAEGNKATCFSMLGSLLLKEFPKVYELAGTSGLKEYTSLAASAGIVKLTDPRNVPGGTDGNRYVTLNSAYRK